MIAKPKLPTQPIGAETIVVVDLFESVKLFENTENLANQSWARFTTIVASKLLPATQGTLIKSLGDGLMITCPDPTLALQASNQFHAVAKLIADEFEIPFALRIGIHQCVFVHGATDIHGHGVNLTARIAGLAQPGETIITADIRDQITDGVDTHIEDMGYSYLKHFKEPVRTFRAHLGLTTNAIAPEKLTALGAKPILAVVPFKCLRSTPEDFCIGEIIADGLIGRLSGSANLRVISRLSASALRESNDVSAASIQSLNASKLVHGSYVVNGDTVLINAQLTDLTTMEVCWSSRINSSIGDLIDAQSTALGKLTEEIQDFLFDIEVTAVAKSTMNSLNGYSLLLSGIGLMHRNSEAEFHRSYAVLEHLQERHARIPELRAWKAKWHVLKVLRGLSIDRKNDAMRALSETARALDIDPNNSLALAVEGYVLCQLTDRVDEAATRIKLALRANPNESLAWLFKSVISAADFNHTDAVGEAQHASVLSPIDPIRYFYRMLIGNAYLVAGEHDLAIRHCQDSIRLNRCHSPTVRILLTAQFEDGRFAEAKKTLNHLLELEPDLTVSRYLAGGDPSNKNRQRCAIALRELGLNPN